MEELETSPEPSKVLTMENRRSDSNSHTDSDSNSDSDKESDSDSDSQSHSDSEVETPTAALPNNSMTQNNLYVGSATDLQKMLIQKAKEKETVIESAR